MSGSDGAGQSCGAGEAVVDVGEMVLMNRTVSCLMKG